MERIDDVREIAEKVMMWRTQAHFNGLRVEIVAGNVRWYPKNLGGGIWGPFTDANAALEVAGAMRVKYRLNLTVHDIGGGQFAAVFSGDCSRRGDFSEGTFCEAICGAALAAVRAKQEER